MDTFLHLVAHARETRAMCNIPTLARTGVAFENRPPRAINSETCTGATRPIESIVRRSVTIRNIRPPTQKMEATKDWYRMIEDIIQCPVCLIVTNSSYIHCVRGHHMCGYCIKKLKQCPMCYDNFLPKIINHLVTNDLASRLGEIQLSIIEDIKSSTTKSQQEQSVQTDLLITNSSVNTQTDEIKLLIPAKKSVHTQTCDDYFHSPNNSNGRKQIINKTHSYPCLICGDYFRTYQWLKAHLHSNHKENLENVSYKENGPILCNDRRFVVQCDKLPWEYEYVILTSFRTLYFVNFLVRSNGCMKCYVRSIDGSYTSTELTESYYRITLQTASTFIHKGKVKPHTAECKMEDMYDVCFQGEEIRSIIKSRMSFAFTFSLHNCK